MFGRNRAAAGKPISQIHIPKFQDFFQGRHIGIRKAADMARNKAADQDIGFLGAAMLGAKNKPATPGVKFCWV